MFSLQIYFLALLHTYFFAFAELEYNVADKNYELSIAATAHDFEAHMKKKGVDLGHIENVNKESPLFKAIEKELNAGFYILTQNKDTLRFNLQDFEVDLRDNATFYLKSNKTNAFTNAEITFDLMMETFGEQQNKLNFIVNNKKQSLTFIKIKPTRKIKL